MRNRIPLSAQSGCDTWWQGTLIDRRWWILCLYQRHSQYAIFFITNSAVTSEKTIGNKMLSFATKRFFVFGCLRSYSKPSIIFSMVSPSASAL